MLHKYDIVVVGAGLAGCAAALTASEKGASVLVVEKSNTIGLPVRCAEFIPKMMLREFHLPDNRFIVNPVDTLRSILPGGKSGQIKSPGYIINKDEYTRQLSLKAAEAGARFMVGTCATKIGNNSVTLRRAGEEVVVETQIIIGADGPMSTVGQWIESRNQKLLAAIQYTYAADNAEKRDVEVFFHPKYKNGYAWIFPKKAVWHIGVGVDVENGGNVREAIQYFIHGLINEGRIREHREIAVTSGIIPTGGILPVIYSRNILLVGDAAGLTDPITGSGNYPAIVSGKYAGEAAADAVLKKDLSLLQGYPEKVTGLFGQVMARAREKRRFMEEKWDEIGLNRLIPRVWVGFGEYYDN